MIVVQLYRQSLTWVGSRPTGTISVWKSMATLECWSPSINGRTMSNGRRTVERSSRRWHIPFPVVTRRAMKTRWTSSFNAWPVIVLDYWHQHVLVLVYLLWSRYCVWALWRNDEEQSLDDYRFCVPILYDTDERYSICRTFIWCTGFCVIGCNILVVECFITNGILLIWNVPCSVLRYATIDQHNRLQMVNSMIDAFLLVVTSHSVPGGISNAPPINTLTNTSYTDTSICVMKIFPPFVE